MRETYNNMLAQHCAMEETGMYQRSACGPVLTICYAKAGSGASEHP